MFLKALMLSVSLIAMLNSSNAQDMFTAAKHLDYLSEQAVAKYGDDLRLVQIISIYKIGQYQISMDIEKGVSEVWMYNYYVPDWNLLVTSVASTHNELGYFIGELMAQEWPGGDTTAINEPWKDSDSAAAIWRSNGLSGYFASNPAAYSAGMVLGHNEAQVLSWYAYATDNIDTLECGVNAVTMEVIECGTTNTVSANEPPDHFVIHSVYPNPILFDNTAKIDIETGRHANVSIHLYNSLGCKTGVVVETEIAPGKRTFVIPAESIKTPGLYFVRAIANEKIVTKRLLVFH